MKWTRIVPGLGPIIAACVAIASTVACESPADSGGPSTASAEAQVKTSPRPQRAGEPLDPARTAGRIVLANGAAALGDDRAARAQIESLADEYRRAIKLPDTTRAVDHEAARRVVRQIDGVRSVAWIDRENLFVIVSRNAARTYATIDAACLAMEPLGDTLGVVVHLQSGDAVDAEDLRILSRNCQLSPGDRALLQRDRAVDVIPDAIQSQHRADNPREAVDKRAWERGNRESMKRIEDTTPEM